jgi:hypothetical protein
LTSRPDDTRHEAVVRYLLGELTDAECDELEEAHFATTDGFGELQAVEQELTDAYVAGDLSPERRLRFESRLVPGQHRDVEFSRALRAVLQDRQSSIARAGVRVRRRLVPWLPAAAAAVFISAVGWLALRASRPEEPPDAGRRETSPPVSTPSQAAPPTPTGPSSTAPGRGEIPTDRSRTLSVTLSAGLTRNDRGLRRIVVPAGADRVVFTLVVDDEGPTTYRAVLQNASGKDLLDVSPLHERATGQGRVVDIPVGAQVLADGDYVLQLQSPGDAGRAEDRAEYAFRVIRH